MRSFLAMFICVWVFGYYEINAADPVASIDIKSPILKPFVTVSIAAGVAGIIDEVYVQEGDLIASKTPLVKIRDDEAMLGLRRAKLALDTARMKAKRDVDIRMSEKSAAVAEQELGRTLKANSLAPDTYPINEVERFRLVWERAKIDIERFQLERDLAQLGEKQAEIEVEQTQQSVARHQVNSPMVAMVVSVDKHAGEWIDANSKIIEIVCTERLKLEGFLDSTDASSVSKGRLVSIQVTLNKSSQIIVGQVSFVSPIVNPVNGQVRVFVEVDNRDAKLRPGIPVFANIPAIP